MSIKAKVIPLTHSLPHLKISGSTPNESRRWHLVDSFLLLSVHTRAWGLVHNVPKRTIWANWTVHMKGRALSNLGACSLLVDCRVSSAVCNSLVGSVVLNAAWRAVMCTVYNIPPFPNVASIMPLCELALRSRVWKKWYRTHYGDLRRVEYYWTS